MVQPRLPETRSVSQVMLLVMLALVPGTLVHAWLFGPGVILNLLLCCVAALVFESLGLIARRKPLAAALSDNSALLTGWLLALTLPPLLPWWITVCGIAVAILLAKQLYGGIGHNPFNPAMVGYAFLLISFPREMTQWLAPEQLLTSTDTLPGLLESARIIAGLENPDLARWNAISMPTPLDRLKHLSTDSTLVTADTLRGIDGFFAAYGWEWTNLAFLLGGLWLLKLSVISWHVPVSLLATLFACYAIFMLIGWFTQAPLVDPAPNMLPVKSPLFGLFSGATMLGAFFIATDPVSCATSRLGRILFGSGIGLIMFFIREFGGYPEGLAFAVLLMNLSAPTLDYYCRSDKAGNR